MIKNYSTRLAPKTGWFAGLNQFLTSLTGFYQFIYITGSMCGSNRHRHRVPVRPTGLSQVLKLWLSSPQTEGGNSKSPRTTSPQKHKSDRGQSGCSWYPEAKLVSWRQERPVPCNLWRHHRATMIGVVSLSCIVSIFFPLLMHFNLPRHCK